MRSRLARTITVSAAKTRRTSPPISFLTDVVYTGAPYRSGFSNCRIDGDSGTPSAIGRGVRRTSTSSSMNSAKSTAARHRKIGKLEWSAGFCTQPRPAIGGSRACFISKFYPSLPRPNRFLYCKILSTGQERGLALVC